MLVNVINLPRSLILILSLTQHIFYLGDFRRDDKLTVGIFWVLCEISLMIFLRRIKYFNFFYFGDDWFAVVRFNFF